MRILFAGTPEIALPSLQALHVVPEPPRGDRPRVVAVLTAPDAPAGRRRVLTSPPVKVQAEALGIPVLQPERLNGDARSEIAALRPDLLVVVAYGRIFGPRFLALFPEGGINLHPSLLPRYRGPSPIPAAILAGDSHTGVTVQRVAREVDAGDILDQREVPLPEDATTPVLEQKLGLLGAEMIVHVVSGIAGGTVRATPQDHSAATWCNLIQKGDGALTWKESAAVIGRMVRAYTPWPGVRCSWKGQSLQLLQVEPLPAVETRGRPGGSSSIGTGTVPGTVLGVDNGAGILVQTVDGVLAVKRLKLQARKEMDFRSFLNGNSSIVGGVLEQA